MRRFFPLALMLTFVPLQAQSPANFDVVSIKPNHSGDAASDTNTAPGRLSLVNVTPLSLILRAFGVRGFQIVGYPDWVASTRFDVVAVTGDNRVLNDQDRQPLMQRLLADRWHFRYHRETRELGVYSLAVVDASKLVRHEGPGQYAMKVEPNAGRVVLRSTRGNIGRLVEILSGFSGRVVIDDTALSGEYDFTLEWVQDPSADAGGPTLFTALREQLGLRLDSVKRPMPVIVVDTIEQPSEN